MWAHVYVLAYFVDTKQELRKCVPLSISIILRDKIYPLKKLCIFCHFDGNKNVTGTLSRKKSTWGGGIRKTGREPGSSPNCVVPAKSLITKFIHYKFLS